MDEEKSREDLTKEADDKAEEAIIELTLVNGYKPFPLTQRYKPRKHTELHIHHPTIGEEADIDDYHSKTMARLVKDKECITESEMMKILEERGIWNRAEDKELDRINDRLSTVSTRIIGLLDLELTDEVKEKLDALRKERDELTEKRDDALRKKQKYLSSTIESASQRELIKKKIQLCVKYPDGSKVWNSLEELNSEEDKTLVYDLIYKCMIFWAGISSRFLEKYLGEISGVQDT